ncbi:ABC transporter substrate-binding protein [Rhodovulum euryhalinum]|uniref:Amino acid/amide ABC transporter substrate-binding protein (HAAT family) n=1 Tax=Rhodovulum euryhalinum TaxID=35805 RepID=A0A4R2KYG5_9RHOB|nr:ABC transporter substrate-binding protein [Rhodovulum euryhalinum]TCO71735.1 amino acid/amide ABC transporter substrate-binding protein (HAAT family) [Rhodovulum euryhalinum]
MVSEPGHWSGFFGLRKRARGALVGAGLAALATLPATAQEVRTAVIRVDYPSLLPLSRLDLPTEDRAFAGAALGTEDNATTGRFMGQTYETVTVAAAPETALAEFARLANEGFRLFVVHAREDELLAMADAAPEGALLFNSREGARSLRSEACRANLLHVAPSDAMRADAVMQFLVWKKWTDLFLVHGSNPADVALADAYRASARKFGAKIVGEREFTDTGGSRVSDSGHVLVQRQLPVFMQDTPDHDVVLAADSTDYFAEYLPYNTWEAAPVAGSAGLVPVTWAPTHESWGATQLQTRFEKRTGRAMRDEDYQTWLAVRVIGEAVTRTGSADPAVLRDYALGGEFALAAFKGQPVTFRPWNGQLRQPILLTNGRMTVSVSPQEGFLHQRSPLDTLGLDEPESACTAFE